MEQKPKQEEELITHILTIGGSESIETIISMLVEKLLANRAAQKISTDDLNEIQNTVIKASLAVMESRGFSEGMKSAVDAGESEKDRQKAMLDEMFEKGFWKDILKQLGPNVVEVIVARNAEKAAREEEKAQLIKQKEEDARLIRKDEEQPIYERVGLKECLIISKTEKDVLVACNEDGNIVFKRVKIPVEL